MGIVEYACRYSFKAALVTKSKILTTKFSFGHPKTARPTVQIKLEQIPPCTGALPMIYLPTR